MVMWNKSGGHLEMARRAVLPPAPHAIRSKQKDRLFFFARRPTPAGPRAYDGKADTGELLT